MKRLSDCRPVCPVSLVTRQTRKTRQTKETRQTNDASAAILVEVEDFGDGLVNTSHECC